MGNERLTVLEAPGYNLGNALACEACDGPDIIDRFVQLGLMLRRCAWWLPENELDEVASGSGGIAP